MVNRAFSLCQDAVLAASIMNQRSHIGKDMQATFYIHTLRPRRRFEKWPKALSDDDTAIIAKYYGMSRREAQLCSGVHTEEHLTEMRRVLKEGASPPRFRSDTH